MESHARQLTIHRWWPVLDRRLAQGGMVIGAFATAAVFAAVYGPGPRVATGQQQSMLPTTTAAMAGTIHEEAASRTDDTVAREIARRKIAEILKRQAAQAAASLPVASTQPAHLDSQNSSAAPAPTVASLSTADLEKLANKAAEAIRTGNIAGARLVLEHAVAAGDTTSIFALAETYDPHVLAQLHVRGMTGDAAKARALYKEALAKGITQARAKLAAFGE